MKVRLDAAHAATASAVVGGAIVVILVLMQVAFSQALYGDGASTLLTVLERKSWFIIDPARSHVQAMSQAPLVWAARAGVHDTHLLSRIYTLGQLLVPAACYVLALAYTRRNDLLAGGILLAVSLGYLNAGLLSHGEYVWAYALGVLMFAVLLGPQALRLRDTLVLVAAAAIAMRSYEIFVLLGPVLLGLAALRLVRDAPRPSWPVRAALAVFMLLLLAAIAIGVRAILNPRDPSNLAGARNLAVLLDNRQLALSIAVATVLLAAAAAQRFGRTALAIAVVAGLALVLAQSLWAPPVQHYLSRAVAGLALVALLAFLALMRVAPRRGGLRGLSPWDSPRPLFVAASLAWLAACALPYGARCLEWRDFIQRYVEEVNTRHGVVPIEATALLAPRYRPFVWWWNNPTLSYLLRQDPAGAVIRNEAIYGGWQPFDPAQPKPALNEYSWR